MHTRPRAVLAVQGRPDPKGFGGPQRLAHWERALTDLGFGVDVVPLQPRPNPRSKALRVVRSLQRILVGERLTDQSTSRLRDALAPSGPAVVIVRPLEFAAAAKRVAGNSASVQADADDYLPAVLRSRAEQMSGLSRRATLYTSKVSLLSMRRLAAKLDHVYFAALEDQELHARPGTSILPNVLPSNGQRSTNSATRRSRTGARFLALGTLSNRHYSAGVEGFIRSIWPRVVLSVPGAELVVVGTGASNSLRKLMARAASVTYTGWIDDVAAAYEDSDVCLALNLTGGGTKIKLLEAMSYGRPVVATPHAVRGTGLRAGEHAIVAPLEEMADACAAAIHDRGKSVLMAATAQDWVLANFTYDKFRDAVAAVLGPARAGS